MIKAVFLLLSFVALSQQNLLSCSWKRIISSDKGATAGAYSPDGSLWYWTTSDPDFLYEKAWDGLYQYRFQQERSGLYEVVKQLEIDANGTPYFLSGTHNDSVQGAPYYISRLSAGRKYREYTQDYFYIYEFQIRSNGEMIIDEATQFYYLNKTRVFDYSLASQARSFAITEEGTLFVVDMYSNKIKIWDTSRNAWRILDYEADKIRLSYDNEIWALMSYGATNSLYIFNKLTQKFEERLKLPDFSLVTRFSIPAKNVFVVSGYQKSTGKYFSDVTTSCYPFSGEQPETGDKSFLNQ